MSDRNRIRSIDALRAVAVLAVLFCHTWPYPGPSDTGLLYSAFEFIRFDILHNGHTGVVLFFVISGYVIPYSLLDHDDGHVRKFVISRIMRLYPAYWLSILIVVLSATVAFDPLLIFANVTMVQNALGFPDLIGPYWSLFVEILFYGLTVVLYLAGLLKGKRSLEVTFAALVGLTLVAAVARRFWDVPLPAGTMTFICLMVYGSWLRIADPGKQARIVVTGLLLAAVLVICLLLYYPENFKVTWLAAFNKHAIAILAFVLGVYVAPLRGRMMVYLGRISYSIYLFHTPLSLMLTLWLVETTEATSYSQGVLLFLLSFATVVALSSITYSYVERPFIQLGKRWTR